MPTADERSLERDPAQLFWWELNADQKRFIENRWKVTTDKEACELTGIPHQTLEQWKKKSRIFRTVYDSTVKEVPDTTLHILAQRYYFITSEALNVLQKFFALESSEVTKMEVERARLAKDFATDVMKHAPRRNQLPKKQDLPTEEAIDIITDEVMHAR